VPLKSRLTAKWLLTVKWLLTLKWGRFAEI
jgi:hypothetical protein